MLPRVHYFSLISTDNLNRRYHVDFHVGSATRKVMGTMLALASAKVRPVVVSALIPFNMGMPFSSVERIERTPYVRLFAVGRGPLRRLTAAISFLCYSVSTVSPRDAVILYNAFPEYILAALYFSLRGRRAILDVEDAPRTDERGLRGAMNSISFLILRKLCDRKVVTVSETLAKALNLTEYYVNYGVSSQVLNLRPTTQRFKLDSPLNILYGGAILPETGLSLFRSAIRRLASQRADLALNFHITGLFDRKSFDSLCSELPRQSGTKIVIHGELSSGGYEELLNSMDVGLCLKLPSHSMGQTTFPSKVVEICASGMLLCSTGVSDVPDIFDDQTAVILKTEEADELISAIIDIAEHQEEMRLRTQRGQRLVEERFGKMQVGRTLRAFLFGESAVVLQGTEDQNV